MHLAHRQFPSSLVMRKYIIQLLVFEEPNIEIYRYVKGDIGRREAEVNITFHTPINLDIGLFKHLLLFYYFSVSSVCLILSKCHVFLSNIANQFIYLFICSFNFGKALLQIYIDI